MMKYLASSADHIYLALGATDFRKQTNGLAAIISLQFQLNIDFMMTMAKEYLDGTINIVTFTLDFPYELEHRYKKMHREDEDYSELIYEDLYEEGILLESSMSETEFKKLIRKKYNYIKKIASEGFW